MSLNGVNGKNAPVTIKTSRPMSKLHAMQAMQFQMYNSICPCKILLDVGPENAKSQSKLNAQISNPQAPFNFHGPLTSTLFFPESKLPICPAFSCPSTVTLATVMLSPLAPA